MNFKDLMSKLDSIAEADATGRIDYKANQAQDAKEKAIADVKQMASTPMNSIPRFGVAIDPKTGQIFYGDAGNDGGTINPKGYPYKWMQPGGPAESIADGNIIKTAGLEIIDKGGYAYVDPGKLATLGQEEEKQPEKPDQGGKPDLTSIDQLIADLEKCNQGGKEEKPNKPNQPNTPITQKPKPQGWEAHGGQNNAGGAAFGNPTISGSTDPNNPRINPGSLRDKASKQRVPDVPVQQATAYNLTPQEAKNILDNGQPNDIARYGGKAALQKIASGVKESIYEGLLAEFGIELDEAPLTQYGTAGANVQAGRQAYQSAQAAQNLTTNMNNMIRGGQQAVQTAAPTIAKAGAKGAVKGGLKGVPFLGAVVNGAEAVMYARDGDYVNAALSATGAVASFFPPIGTAVATGIGTYQTGREIVSAFKDDDTEPSQQQGGKTNPQQGANPATMKFDPNVQALQKRILAKDPNALPKFGADGKMGPETQAAMAKTGIKESRMTDHELLADLRNRLAMLEADQAPAADGQQTAQDQQGQAQIIPATAEDKSQLDAIGQVLKDQSNPVDQIVMFANGKQGAVITPEGSGKSFIVDLDDGTTVLAKGGVPTQFTIDDAYAELGIPQDQTQGQDTQVNESLKGQALRFLIKRLKRPAVAAAKGVMDYVKKNPRKVGAGLGLLALGASELGGKTPPTPPTPPNGPTGPTTHTDQGGKADCEELIKQLEAAIAPFKDPKYANDKQVQAMLQKAQATIDAKRGKTADIDPNKLTVGVTTPAAGTVPDAVQKSMDAVAGAPTTGKDAKGNTIYTDKNGITYDQSGKSLTPESSDGELARWLKIAHG